MAYRGYHFFVGELELPYAPSELKVTIGSNNQTVALIDGSEINILKNPKLTEVEFDIELPRGRQYPFANTYVAPEIYLDNFEKLMVEKTPVQLVITRPNPFLKGQNFSGKRYVYGNKTNDFFSTDLIVSLEGYTTKESAENAYDIAVSLKFKEYTTFGTVKKVVGHKVPVVKKPVSKGSKSEKYVVKKGDCLWKISRKFYGEGTKWKTIYDANKAIIEETAKKYGKKSSSNGHWIYPGTELVIPMTSK